MAVPRVALSPVAVPRVATPPAPRLPFWRATGHHGGVTDFRLARAEETRVESGCPAFADFHALVWRTLDMITAGRSVPAERVEAWIADGSVVSRLNGLFETPTELADTELMVEFLQTRFGEVDIRDRGNGLNRLLAVLITGEEALLSLYKTRLG